METPASSESRWRVVLDTNVLISGLRFGGKPAEILELASREAFVFLTSEPLKLELVRILAGKFRMPDDLIAEVCGRLWTASECIVPVNTSVLCPDEADNRVLECALDGEAGYIVTGDHHLLDLTPIKNLAIVTPDAFLTQFHAVVEALGKSKRHPRRPLY